MPKERGAGRVVANNTPAGNAQNGTTGGANDNDENGAVAGGGEGRPVCLPLPSPPRLPSKRTLSDRLVDSTAAKLEAKCTVSGGAMAASVAGGTLKASAPVTAALPPPWGTGGGTVDVEARERTAQAWIEAVSGKNGVTYETRQFARNLKRHVKGGKGRGREGGKRDEDGEILCALVNAIRPGTIPHVHESQLGFEQTENIDNFLAACCKLGVPAHALVDTADIFEMRDTPRVVECLHALGSAVQASCPAFAGPHLGPAADPSVVAAVPPADDEKNEPSEGGDDDDEDDDEDGAFGDFWRASTRSRGEAIPGGRNDRTGTGAGSLALNMQMINSPRALVFNSDPVGHPTRSPTVRAAWESEVNATGGRSAWGTDLYPAKRGPKTPSNHSATSSRTQTLSPAGLWGTGVVIPRAAEGVGKSVSPAAPQDSHTTTTTNAGAPETHGEEPEATGGGGADSVVASDFVGTE
eukprot:g7202.t1